MEVEQTPRRGARKRRSLPLPKVEVEFLMVADAAEAVNGKLYVHGGGWDTMQVVSFSAPIAFAIAVGILVPWNETDDDHALTLTIEDADGRPAGPQMAANFRTGRSPLLPKGASTRVLLAIKVQLLLPSPGTYTLTARVDGQEDTRRITPIHLRPLQPQVVTG